MTWSAEDFQAVRVLEQGLGPIHVLKIIEHKENRMTDVANPEMPIPSEDWGQETESPVTYPEVADNPHNHVYTWSPKLPDGSMMAIRAQTAEGVAEAAEALVAVAARLRAAWQGVTGTPQQAPQAPAQGYQTPPPHAPQGATPPPFGPNVSVPQAPGYQGPPAPPQQQWGGQQQGQRQEYPAPQGWFRLNGAYKAQVDAVAAQHGIPKGNPGKGGKYNFFGLPQKSWYCAPEVVTVFGQFSPVPA